MNGKKELKHQRLINVGKKNPTVIIFLKPLFIVISGVKRLSAGDLDAVYAERRS